MNSLSLSEIQILNQYAILPPDSRRQLQSYLSYLVVQQCRYELYSQLINNPWFFNNLQSLYLLSESTDSYCAESMERVRRIKNICLGVYEHFYDKYAPLLENFEVFDGVLEGVFLGLNHIYEAARNGSFERTRLEVIEMFETYKSLTQGDNRGNKIRAM